MTGPVHGGPEYEAWVRSVIASTQETIRRSQELVRRTDAHLSRLNTPIDGLSGRPASDIDRTRARK